MAGTTAHVRRFRREDVMQFEAEAVRLTILGMALCGRTSADLQRQLNAPYPEIPSGCYLTDLRKLQRTVQKIPTALGTYVWETRRENSPPCHRVFGKALIT